MSLILSGFGFTKTIVEAGSSSLGGAGARARLRWLCATGGARRGSSGAG